MSEKATLSSADVARLLKDPNDDNRAAAAVKVAETFTKASLSPSERALAEDIFRAMLKDAAIRVRRALAESLKDNAAIPHDVAKALAQDVDEVALPVIEKSVVLTDEDLIAIIAKQGAAAQKAVANRAVVSGDVADALVQTKNEDVIVALVSNEGAQIRENTYQQLLEDFKDSDKVKEPLVNRAHLPLSIAERLVNMVSERLREHIMTHHEISAVAASDIFIESRERATVSLLKGSERSAVLELIEQLHQNKRLTPSLVMRALFMGDTTFFEAALARMVGIPVANAYKLVHDQGNLGLTRLFEAARIPKQFVVIARAALDLADEMRQTAGDDHEAFRQLMIERVLTRVDSAMDADSIDYLLSKLRTLDDRSGKKTAL